MSAVTEEWQQRVHTRRDDVKISGADAFVEVERRHAQPGERIWTLPVGRVVITWTWGDPNDDAAPGEPSVTLHTAGRDGRLDGGKLFLDQLWRVPEWLSVLVQRSMPRL